MPEKKKGSSLRNKSIPQVTVWTGRLLTATADVVLHHLKKSIAKMLQQTLFYVILYLKQGGSVL